jgi:hypothetical protein
MFSILCILCFCIVSPFVYSCLVPIFVQVYWPQASGGNPIAVNKYHIIYILTIAEQNCWHCLTYERSGPLTDAATICCPCTCFTCMSLTLCIFSHSVFQPINAISKIQYKSQNTIHYNCQLHYEVHIMTCTLLRAFVGCYVEMAELCPVIGPSRTECGECEFPWLTSLTNTWGKVVMKETLLGINFRGD